MEEKHKWVGIREMQAGNWVHISFVRYWAAKVRSLST